MDPDTAVIELESKGTHDGDIAVVKVNEYDYCYNKRGFNVATFTLKGKFLKATSFDTVSTPWAMLVGDN